MEQLLAERVKSWCGVASTASATTVTGGVAQWSLAVGPCKVYALVPAEDGTVVDSIVCSCGVHRGSARAVGVLGSSWGGLVSPLG